MHVLLANTNAVNSNALSTGKIKILRLESEITNKRIYASKILLVLSVSDHSTDPGNTAKTDEILP